VWDGVIRTADVPILMYHYISAPPTANDRLRYSLSVNPAMFEAQLQALQEHGFSTVTLRDLYQHLATGQPLPQRPIVLTFDDGYLDNYLNAFPLLKKYGMTGTFFVLTGRADAGDPAYLSWDMIQELSNAGMDIQLHAREHYDLRNRSYEWLVFNLIGGRQSIEGHTGRPVNFIAYTSGKYDAGLLSFLRQTNFWAAVTTHQGRQHTLNEPLLWTRVRISGQLRLSDFAKLLKINSNSVNSDRKTTPKQPFPTSDADLHPSPEISD
jgi:peptidoglycan/xylan/chitin deacetylase (PgdA/CDA1 family)